jgi:DNA mismatch endonuclease (patch repair protein)
MPDIHNKETRSYNMSRIRGKDTKPEIAVRKFLYEQGFRYRLQVKTLPGRPDIVLPKYKTIIFVHGCFWHGHENCIKAKLPKTREEWWKNKIERNIENDRRAIGLLREKGWRVVEVWGCQVTSKTAKKTFDTLIKFLAT